LAQAYCVPNRISSGMAAYLQQLESIVKRLEKVADTIDAKPQLSAAAGAPPPAGGSGLAGSFGTAISPQLAAVNAAAQATGAAAIISGSEVFAKAVNATKDVLSLTATCKKPGDTQWQQVLKDVMAATKELNPDNRSEFFDHQKVVSEACGVCMFVVNPAPADHCQNQLESLDFHGIKVMRRGVQSEKDWVQAVKKCLSEMKSWCSENCKMGLTWNANGADPTTAAPGGGAGKSAPPKGKSGAPGKAPPKGAGPPKAAPAAAPAAAGMAAVFADITQGDVTSGLKKVTADMQTHKNTDLRAGATVAAKTGAAAPARGAAAAKARGPPKCCTERGNWVVENYDKPAEMLTLDEVNMKQLVYVSFCRNATIKVSGKIKSITLDTCEKVNVVVHDVVSSVELVNCERCQVQTTGVVPTFAIDKSNGVQVYLSEASKEAVFTTSKSSEMNVNIPVGDEMAETPIPEQFVSRFVNGKLQTTVSELYSG